MSVYKKGERGFLGYAGKAHTPERVDSATLAEREALDDLRRSANSWHGDRVVQWAEERYAFNPYTPDAETLQGAHEQSVREVIAQRASFYTIRAYGLNYVESDFSLGCLHTSGWDALFYAERLEMEDDYRNYVDSMRVTETPTPVNDERKCEVIIGRVNVSDWRNVLRGQRKLTAKKEFYYSDRESPSFNRTNALVLSVTANHIYSYVNVDDTRYSPAQLDVMGSDRIQMESPNIAYPVNEITLCLQWLTNTGAYPSCLDIEHKVKTGMVELALDLSTDHLILRTIGERTTAIYRIPVDGIILNTHSKVVEKFMEK